MMRYYTLMLGATLVVCGGLRPATAQVGGFPDLLDPQDPKVRRQAEQQARDIRAQSRRRQAQSRNNDPFAANPRIPAKPAGQAMAANDAVPGLPGKRGPENEARNDHRNGNRNDNSIQQQRRWLREQLVGLAKDTKSAQQILRKVDALTDDQVRELAARVQREIRYRAAQLQQAHATRNRLQQQLAQQQLAQQRVGPRGPVGFAPVITTLPTGAHLTAGAVVSPDRRYVRINAMPFFSSIPHVHTFNYFNGVTRHYPGYGHHYNRNYVPPHHRRPRADRGIEVYHDGLRTRVRSR